MATDHMNAGMCPVPETLCASRVPHTVDDAQHYRSAMNQSMPRPFANYCG